MKQKQIKTDVGILVGRFQVPSLHQAHLELINHVIESHDLTVIFLGLSPALVTCNNPLNFASRKQMLTDEFGDKLHNILYIKDMSDDRKWSKILDIQINDVIPNKSVTLYGGRESFIDHYHGSHPCQELEQESYISGTEIRKQISNQSNTSEDFRRGVIWAAHNQYKKTMPTIDAAIWDGRHEKLLMGRKEHEDLFRFLGGFVNPGETLETAIRREVDEESHIEIGAIKYIDSMPVDDWRYRREKDKILTVFFSVLHIFGNPTPDDDIVELKWFDFDTITTNDLVEEHGKLLEILQKSEVNLIN